MSLQGLCHVVRELLEIVFTPFDSSVLKPNLDLSFWKRERRGQLLPLYTNKVLVFVEFFFQSFELVWCKNCPFASFLDFGSSWFCWVALLLRRRIYRIKKKTSDLCTRLHTEKLNKAGERARYETLHDLWTNSWIVRDRYKCTIKWGRNLKSKPLLHYYDIKQTEWKLRWKASGKLCPKTIHD